MGRSLGREGLHDREHASNAGNRGWTMNAHTGHGRTVYACGHLQSQCRCVEGGTIVRQLTDLCPLCRPVPTSVLVPIMVDVVAPYALLLQSDEQDALIRLVAIACSAVPGPLPSRIHDELQRREALFRESMNERALTLSQTPLAAAARSVAHDVTCGWLG